MKIKLCAFADEYSENFEEQLKALNEFGIPYIELRGIDGKNVSELSVSDAIEVKSKLDAYNIKVWSIGSPLGKVNLDYPFEKHLEVAENVFKVANILDCDKVRVFSFFTKDYDSVKDEVISRLIKMCALAKKYGVTLYHENEKDIFGDSAERCKLLLDSVQGLKCVYDPANFIQCKVSVDYAMELLNDKIDYYHIKDAFYQTGAVVPAGKGDGKIETLIDNISLQETVLTLEPHLAVFKGYDKIDKSKLVNFYAYRTNRDAFIDAVTHLKNILLKLGYKEIENQWIK
ncbi:MAG: sugar phosphate isomerase/epimerase [Clostridia bacterium]|nr:sugar phosphate isomerase/epimerase [Clostridia bacterium]